MRKTDFTNIKCCICGKENLTSSTAIRELDEKGIWTKRWMHSNCDGLRKQLAHRRTGNLTEHRNILADDSQEVTCKVFGVEDLNNKNNNYSRGSPIDHSPIPKGVMIMIGDELTDLSEKTPQTKGAHFSRYIGANGGWNFAYGTIEYEKEYDIMILWCISKDEESIERGYVIPKWELTKRKGIGIIKNPSRNVWYYPYRINDKNIIKKADEAWKDARKRRNDAKLKLDNKEMNKCHIEQ